MPRASITALINQIEDRAVVIADGAMGTELMRRGAEANETLNCNRTHPDWVRDIHRSYIEAGARLLYSNTFAPPKHRDEYADVLAGWQILRDVCRQSKEKLWMALSLYPTTARDHPELLDALFQMENAPDLVVLETCGSLMEVKTAVDAVRQRSSAYIFATATFSHNGRMRDGTSPGHWQASCRSSHDIFQSGMNCDVDWKSTPPPCLYKPSAGLPDVPEAPIEEWVENIAVALEYGIRGESEGFEWFSFDGHIIGGCCGTTPEHILALTELGQSAQKQQEFF
jgi:5-methyltetrahydrofolate--homocysteine methyltransferase